MDKKHSPRKWMFHILAFIGICMVFSSALFQKEMGDNIFFGGIVVLIISIIGGWISLVFDYIRWKKQ